MDWHCWSRKQMHLIMHKWRVVMNLNGEENIFVLFWFRFIKLRVRPGQWFQSLEHRTQEAWWPVLKTCNTWNETTINNNELRKIKTNKIWGSNPTLNPSPLIPNPPATLDPWSPRSLDLQITQWPKQELCHKKMLLQYNQILSYTFFEIGSISKYSALMFQ